MARKLLMIQENMASVKRIIDRALTDAQKTGVRSVFGHLWTSDCLLCLESVVAARVCVNCERLLASSVSRCAGCAIPLPFDGWCGDCLRAPPPYDDVVTAFDYRFPIDHLIRRFKFSADLAAGAYLGDCLASATATIARPDLIVASPASAARLRERGFDPALLLARRIGAALGIAVESRTLVKLRHTPPQTGLDRPGRRRNLRGAFSVRRRLDGLRIAVVDDVMTTGATLSVLARVLKVAGAARVSGWVVARTPEPPREA